MIDISSEFFAGPKPDVEYGNLVTEMSQLGWRSPLGVYLESFA